MRSSAPAPQFAAVTLGQKLLQLVLPGVPDVYQGSELVDRRWSTPTTAGRSTTPSGAAVLASLDVGHPPRPGRREAAGDRARAAAAPRAPRVVRRAGRPTSRSRPRLRMPWPSGAAARAPAVVAVATRLPEALVAGGGCAEHTLALPAGGWHDVLGGPTPATPGAPSLAALLARLPVALLVRKADRRAVPRCGRPMPARRRAAARAEPAQPSARRSPDGSRARPAWWAGVPRGRRTATRLRASALDGGDPRARPAQRAGSRDGVARAEPQRSTPAGFAWTDAGWRGRELAAGGVLYELHVGHLHRTRAPSTRPSAGSTTSSSSASTSSSCMPVAAFAGRHGWGYDGVDLVRGARALRRPGRAEALRRRGHARGLGVCLDVVYNHLGPSGNYLRRVRARTSPTRTARRGAPALNLDGAGSDEVRAFLVDNALSWLRDFHLDGAAARRRARSCATTARCHVLEELSARSTRCADELGRPLVLVAESDRNDPATVDARGAGWPRA